MNSDFIEKYLKETEEIARSIDRSEIDKFIEILFETWKNEKKVITMGNGGSASTASHFAADLSKTVANDSSFTEISLVKGFKAICLNDNSSVLTAWINDTGWDKAYAGLLNTLLEPGDTILLVSVHGGSGWSGNLGYAMDVAKKRGVKILGLAGFDGGTLKQSADACVVVPKNSTPHTEGFHLVVQHLVVDRLRERIQEFSRENITIDTIQNIIQNAKEGDLDLDKLREIINSGSKDKLK
jgi:D-sedoheptulose 7-phosphate isomerase